VKWTRRKFVLGGSVAVGAAAGFSWVACSKRFAARALREGFRELRRPVAKAPIQPDPQSWPSNQITLCWLGHATVLINFYGLRILTDPVLGNRCGVDLPLGTAGPKRFIAPALRFEQLPPIDVVLLSHAHMDHMDLATLGRFKKAPFAVTASETRDVLAATSFKSATELRWGEHATFRNGKSDLRIEAFEVKHWGVRWPKKTPRGYNGYVLEREGRKILFGGDTANTPLFASLRSKGPFDLAIMPIAAYQPWIRNHCTPEQAFAMSNQASARYVVPVHHQTFKLSDEPMDEPIQRMREAMAKEPERLALQRVGETFTLA